MKIIYLIGAILGVILFIGGVGNVITALEDGLRLEAVPAILIFGVPAILGFLMAKVLLKKYNAKDIKE